MSLIILFKNPAYKIIKLELQKHIQFQKYIELLGIFVKKF